MSILTINVDSEPKATPRARAFARKVGSRFVARVYTPQSAEGWKSEIALAVRKHLPKSPHTCACKVDMSFRFARPPSHFGTGKNAGRLKPSAPSHHTGKPDTDNLAKCVMDVLSKVGYWKDDSQAVQVWVEKYWSDRGGMTLYVYPKEWTNQ